MNKVDLITEPRGVVHLAFEENARHLGRRNKRSAQLPEPTGVTFQVYSILGYRPWK